jgi:hypothetical protein
MYFRLKITFLLLVVLIIISSCKTAVVNGEKYKVSQSTTYLGHIGHSKSILNTHHTFSARSIPTLQDKVRLDIQILPFTKKLYAVYLDKVAVGQSEITIKYVDSLKVKPEFVKITILDLNSFAGEINSPYNINILNYLVDTKEAVMVSGVAMALPIEDILRIRQADAYYLVNNQDKNYTIVLYKQGKKVDAINLKGVTLAYSLSKFCWAVNNRSQWYIGDIVKDSGGCKGNTNSRIKEKHEENLYKM